MSRPVRILEFRYSDGPGGGPEKTILLGTARTDPGRFAVTVCYLRDARDEAFDIGDRAARLGLDYTEIRQRHAFDPAIWSAARRLVRDRRIDIVHAHDYKTNLIALGLSRAEGVIPLSTAHGYTGHARRERLIYYPADKRLLARFPQVIAVSNQIRAELLRHGARPERVRTILNGIDHRAFRRDPRRAAEARGALGLNPGETAIGAVGRLEPQKRFDVLMRAFAGLRHDRPGLRLLIAGEGGARAELEAEAVRLGLGPECRLLGHRSDIADFYQALDVYVQSSDYEGTPNVVLEAMALEAPVVATDVGGTAELIEHGSHGLIVPPGDPGALAAAIGRVLDDREGTARRVAAARARVEKELSFDARMEAVEAIYTELMVGARSRGVGELNAIPCGPPAGAPRDAMRPTTDPDWSDIMLKTSVLNPLARSVSSLAREDGACPRSAASTPGQDIRPRSPIRVCFLIDRLLRAGTEGQLLMLIRHLDRSRVEPLLCLLDGEDDLSRSLEPADCPVLRLGVRSLHHPSTLARALSFARFLRRHRVDVVQIYYPDSTYLGVPVARLVGIPRVVHTRFNLGYWMTPLHRWLARVANRFVDATVTNCEACRASVIADEWPARGSVVVLENGIDLSRFEGIGPVGGAGRPRRVGLAANLRPVKEPGLFVRAAALVARDHPDLAFQLAGEGELRPDLERLISELGLGGRVELLGRVEDMPAFLDGLDVAVLCSRSEGLPNAILEYMAAGRAVVATAVGGTVDLIEDGVHGLLVPPGDPGRLAGAIDRLLGDPGLAARLGAAARLRALERYGAGARARRYEAFYERLVSGI